MLDYGIVGNCKSCALIKKDGSIDWFCYPNFNSPSVFGKILDKNAGSFEIIPEEKCTITQKYLENTNILETTFYNKDFEFQVIDFFPRYRKIVPKKGLFRQNRLIRIIKPIRGNPHIKVLYNPRLNYSDGEQTTSIVNDNIVTKNKLQELSLLSNLSNDIISGQVYFKLDYTKYFVIGDHCDPENFDIRKTSKLLKLTKDYWNEWVNTLVLPKEHRDLIIRSALVLKLLTFSETGAIIAAPTTSIPEEVGSKRNWDYRFCWVRDASFTVDALKKIGRNYEAKNLMEFIFNSSLKKKKHLQIMYGIHGESELEEQILEHLEGFQGSKPVRIGNGAYNQKQNDIYGSLIDVIYLYYVYYKYDKKMPLKFWRFVKYLVKEIKKHWQEPDRGIWEFRGMEKEYTYSKLMCYVGIDRAIMIANYNGKTNLAQKWAPLRDEIKAEIMKKAYKDGAFRMFYGTKELDAAVLQMSYHGFLDADDPKMISTVKKIHEELSQGVFVQRYKIKDDNGHTSSAFTICSFWLIDALFNSGYEELAKDMFNELSKCSNHLGLFSEDHDIKTKTLIGNFPQAYTHIALMNTAILLSEWKSKRIEIEQLDFKIY